MEIKIKKTGSEILSGNLPGVANTYLVTEDGREFHLVRTSHKLGNSIGVAGKKGILYVDMDDNKVHWQVAAPSGACGLYTDDEIFEGLSPFTLRALLITDQCNEADEVAITIG